MVAAVSQDTMAEQDPTTMPPDDEPPPLDVASSLRVRKGATHWGIRRYTANGLERLPFGTHEYTKDPVFWAAASEYTGETILSRFGPGTYQINWRVVGPGKNQTIGKEDINIRAALPDEPADAAPIRTVVCRACSSDVMGRFCGTCGTPAGEEPRRSPPMVPAAAPAQAAPATTAAMPLADPMACFQLGVTFATQAMQSTAQIARADADARQARYETDMKATLERERMAHDKAMRDQSVFYERTARAMPDPDQIVAKIEKLVESKLATVAERLDAIDAALEDDGDGDDDDDDDDDKATTPVVVQQGEWSDKVNAGGQVVEKVVVPVIESIGGMVKSFRDARTNGASNAQSGSGA